MGEGGDWERSDTDCSQRRLIMLSNDFLSSIKVVGFDADQTLIDESFSLRRRWQETLERFSHLSGKLTETFLSIFDSKGHQYKKHLSDTLWELNISENHTDHIINFFKSTRSTEECLYDGVKDMLLLLRRRGFRIGIITDGRKDYQEHRLKVAGIYGLFDFFYYGDTHQKPDPTFFRRCIENERIKPHELLYVGDHFEKDIEGALAVGAKTCWINKDATKISQDVIAFKTMYNFYQWLQRV